MMAKVLVADDEINQQELVRANLASNGFEVLTASDGVEAFEQILLNKPDLVILDWMMPRLSGVDLCRKLRNNEETKGMPIIILSARGEETDRSFGLDCGADDYVPKPFFPKELVSRVNSLLRRARPSLGAEVLRFKDLEVDLVRVEVRRGGHLVSLSTKEFKLLTTLMERPGQVYSRDHLLNLIWGHDVYVEDRTVDVHMSRLRKALSLADILDKPFPDIIRTVRGIGYAMKENT
ncbi:MAG: response regulator [Parvibaculales bacterium]